MPVIAKMIERWNIENTPVEERLREALVRLDRAYDERIKIDRRIHQQRVALRENWQIVEMRRKWLGSDTARKMYASLFKRHRTLRDSLTAGQG